MMMQSFASLSLSLCLLVPHCLTASTKPCPNQCQIDTALARLDVSEAFFTYAQEYTKKGLSKSFCDQARLAYLNNTFGPLSYAGDFAQDAYEALDPPDLTTAAPRERRHRRKADTPDFPLPCNCTYQSDCFEQDFIEAYDRLNKARGIVYEIQNRPCWVSDCQKLLDALKEETQQIHFLSNELGNELSSCRNAISVSVQAKAGCPIDQCTYQAAQISQTIAEELFLATKKYAELSVTLPTSCCTLKESYHFAAVGFSYCTGDALKGVADLFPLDVPQVKSGSRPTDCSSRLADILTIGDACVEGSRKALNSLSPRCCDPATVFDNSALLANFASTYAWVTDGIIFSFDACAACNQTRCNCNGHHRY